MADSKIAQKIETGVAGTTKGSALNLANATKAADAKAEAEGKAEKVPAGGKKYQTCGQSNFSISGIKFGGPYYVTTDKEEQELLDSCVERGLLKEVK